MTLNFTPDDEGEAEKPEIVVEEIEPDEDEDPEEICEIQRLTPAEAGACDGCGDHKSKLMLALTYSKNYLVLCPICEGITLTKLLSNYLRRKSRGKTNGFSGDILKEEAEDLDLDEQAILELEYGRDFD